MKLLEQEFEVLQQSTIEIFVDKGSVNIWGWENNLCKVVVADDHTKINKVVSLEHIKLELLKGDKKVDIYIPNQSKLLLEGGNIKLQITNHYGNLNVDVAKGFIKLSNYEGSGIIEIEQGDMELENIIGKLILDKGKGNVKCFNISGNVTVDSGRGDFQLTSISGEWQLDTGSGNMIIEDGSGCINLDCGKGDLMLENCSFTKLAAEGTGATNISLKDSFKGTWNISRNGDYSITTPTTAGIKFRVECDKILNYIPVLEFTSQGEIHRGSMGLNCQGAIYIDGGKVVKFQKEKEGGNEKETLKILEMLKNGVITSQEAEELLVALEQNKEVD